MAIGFDVQALGRALARDPFSIYSLQRPPAHRENFMRPYRDIATLAGVEVLLLFVPQPSRTRLFSHSFLSSHDLLGASSPPHLDGRPLGLEDWHTGTRRLARDGLCHRYARSGGSPAFRVSEGA